MKSNAETSGVSINKYEAPIILSQVSINRMRTTEFPCEVSGLYNLYYAIALWQDTNQVRATTGFMAKRAKWSLEKTRKIKKILISLRLIQDVIQKDKKTGSVIGHYVQVNFIWVDDKTHPTGNPQCGQTIDKCLTQTNSLSTKLQTNSLNNNIFAENFEISIKRKRREIITINDNTKLLQENEQLKEKIKQLENQLKPIQSELFEKDKLITPSQFEMFWELYPRKANKGTALSAFLKLCNQKSKVNVQPTLKVVKTALQMQIKSELWTKEPQFIPYASTWLNNNGWLNDANEMKVFKKDVKVKPTEKRSFGFVGKPIKYKQPIEM